MVYKFWWINGTYKWGGTTLQHFVGGDGLHHNLVLVVGGGGHGGDRGEHSSRLFSGTPVPLVPPKGYREQLYSLAAFCCHKVLDKALCYSSLLD